MQREGLGYPCWSHDITMMIDELVWVFSGVFIGVLIGAFIEVFVGLFFVCLFRCLFWCLLGVFISDATEYPYEL